MSWYSTHACWIKFNNSTEIIAEISKYIFVGNISLTAIINDLSLNIPQNVTKVILQESGVDTIYIYIYIYIKKL